MSEFGYVFFYLIVGVLFLLAIIMGFIYKISAYYYPKRFRLLLLIGSVCCGIASVSSLCFYAWWPFVIGLGGVLSVYFGFLPKKGMLANSQILSQIEKLPPQDELALIEFLTSRFIHIRNLNDLFAQKNKFFVDISNENESLEQIKQIGITNFDTFSMLGFRTNISNYGEMELVFYQNKLVQCGILITYHVNKQDKALKEVFKIVRNFLQKDFHMIKKEERNIIHFSDNVKQCYIHAINGCLAFRMADLNWCQVGYGTSNIFQSVG